MARTNITMLILSLTVFAQSDLRAAEVRKPSKVSELTPEQVAGARKIASAIFHDRPSVVEETFNNVFTIHLLIGQEERALKLATQLTKAVTAYLVKKKDTTLRSFGNSAGKLFISIQDKHISTLLDALKNKPEGFEKLSPDTILEIVGYLQYCDIASLGKTCKFLRSALSPERLSPERLSPETYWSTKSFQPIILKDHESNASKVKFSSDGNILYSMGKNQVKSSESPTGLITINTINAWNVKTYKLENKLVYQEYPIDKARFAAKKHLVATTRMRSSFISVWSEQTDQTHEFNFPERYSIYPVKDFYISADGSLLAAAHEGSYNIFLWHVDSGEQKTLSISNEGRLYGLLFLPDNTLVSFHKNGNHYFLLWNLETLKTQKLEIQSPATLLKFYRNGTILGYNMADSKITLWDVKTNRQITEIIDNNSITSVNFSGDGKLIAAGHHDGSIKIWNIETGTLIKQLTGNVSTVNDLAFSHEGRRLASAHQDGTVILWE